jgi:hypothetical protein
MVAAYFDIAVRADDENGIMSKFMGQELEEQ